MSNTQHNPAIGAAARLVALPASATDINVVCHIEDDREFDRVALGACLIGGFVIDEACFRVTRWEVDGVSYMATNCPRAHGKERA